MERLNGHLMNRVIVAPLAGAWIEIISRRYQIVPGVVAPLAGAWIEILFVWLNVSLGTGRSSRRSVD
ncbi:MAG: hypothetical protein PWP56_1242 [Acetobacterium sp.]|nr:hypothetical protein [Acetobacterium sp.]